MTVLVCLCHVTVLVYGDFGENTQHIGCFNPACDVLTIAKGVSHLTLYQTRKCPQLRAYQIVFIW